MAAPFPVSPQSNYVPEIFSKKLNVRFYESTCLTDVCNMNWEGEIAGQGSKVIIRQVPEVSIADYTGTVSYEDLGEGTVELLIDKAKSYAFKDDDVFASQRDIKSFINEATTNAAEKMKIAVEKDVFSTVYTGAGKQIDAVTVPVTKDNVLDYIVDAGTALDEKNIPDSSRFIIIPPWMAGLIKKSDLKDASLAGDGTSMLRNGRLGMLDRFTVYVSNNLTADGAGSNEFHCLAGTKDAIAFAGQFVKNESVRLESTFGDGYRGLKTYGYKVVHADSLVDLHAIKG